MNMEVVPVRLPEDLLSQVERVAKWEHVERSVALRKLLAEGIDRYVAGQYRLGRLSLREAAEWLGVPLRVALERLVDAGAAGNVAWDQARSALSNAIRLRKS